VETHALATAWSLLQLPISQHINSWEQFLCEQEPLFINQLVALVGFPFKNWVAGSMTALAAALRSSMDSTSV
jgi:hypothetical protein